MAVRSKLSRLPFNFLWFIPRLIFHMLILEVFIKDNFQLVVVIAGVMYVNRVFDFTDHEDLEDRIKELENSKTEYYDKQESKAGLYDRTKH